MPLTPEQDGDRPDVVERPCRQLQPLQRGPPCRRRQRGQGLRLQRRVAQHAQLDPHYGEVYSF